MYSQYGRTKRLLTLISYTSRHCFDLRPMNLRFLFYTCNNIIVKKYISDGSFLWYNV